MRYCTTFSFELRYILDLLANFIRRCVEVDMHSHEICKIIMSIDLNRRSSCRVLNTHCRSLRTTFAPRTPATPLRMHSGVCVNSPLCLTFTGLLVSKRDRLLFSLC